MANSVQRTGEECRQERRGALHGRDKPGPKPAVEAEIALREVEEDDAEDGL
jgi:hypothetical protein